jgi:hypothetical protein
MGTAVRELRGASVWTAALRQDGEVHEIKGPDGERISYQVAELTGLRDLTGWPRGCG